MTHKEYMKKLGERISKLRNEKLITQIELASECNIEPTNLIRLEKGRTNPTVKTLRSIAQGLGISVRDLFDFDGN